MKIPTILGGVAIAAAAAAGGYLLRPPPGANEPKAEAKVEPKVPNQLQFPDGAPQLTAIKTDIASEAPLPIAEPLNGKIAYDEDVTARISSPIAGRIIALRAAAGDVVKAGDVLATIDAPDLAAAVADARKAEADEARKKLSLERAQKLLDAEVVPRKDFEIAAADLAQAQAETQRARLRLKNLAPAGGPGERGLTLRSPVSGVVADRRANPSMEVQPGMADPLFVVSNLKRLWVLIDLPEHHLKSVSAGLPVSVSVEAYPGQAFRATVSRIGQVVNPDTRRIQVRCDIANPDSLLKPEMYARVALLTSEGLKAVRLPNNALVTEGLYSFVFVEARPRVFVKRKVELAVQDREYSYVKSGLTKGERVVVGGALLLQSELASGT
jgi:cobalt-zinc-cadmium efflux system membrane fusion protein